MNLSNLPFQIFGSKSSRDYDVIVFVDDIGTIQESHELISKLDKLLAIELPDKPINCNIAVLEDGMIKRVFKGYPLEVNNSAFYTYDNHRQFYANHIKKTYELTEDIKHFKLKRCLRFILSFYSRVPEWRLEIKEAMRGDFKMRLEACRKIDFVLHKEFPKKKDPVEDIYKTFTFQIVQTLALMQGIEIYSKEDVIEYWIQLEPLINRKPIDNTDLTRLQNLFNFLLRECELAMPNMKSLTEEILN